MKLERIHLHNFRCFERLTVEFDPKLTVIVAENGSGKTAILDAVATGFGRYLTKLGKRGQALKQSDIRITDKEQLAPFSAITVAAAKTNGSEPESLVWSLTRKRDPASKIDTSFPGTRALDQFALQSLQRQHQGTIFLFPLLVYYGTNRAVLSEGQYSKSAAKKFAPLDALDGALESTSRFQSAFAWFQAMEDRDYSLPQLKYVRTAVEKFFFFSHAPHQEHSLPILFSHLRTQKHPSRLVIDRLMPDGVTRTLQISQLSDGYRTMLGLVMDLARRQAQAFANSPNIVSGFQAFPCIVLIDEIDLHLHPAWQQTVLSSLQKIFRGTQFIVTTHSPQVLSTVKRESIRVIGPDATGKIIAAPPLAMTYGEPSGDVLHSVMRVDPQPPVDEKPNLQKLTEWVDQGQYATNEAKALMQSLASALGEQHPQLQRLVRSIQRQEALKK